MLLIAFSAFSKTNLMSLVQRGGEMGTAQLQGGLMLMLSYIMPCVSFLFISFQPGAVQLYFLVSSLIAFGQARILTNNLFRKVMRLHPTVPNPKKATSPILSPSAGPSGSNTNTTATPLTNTITPAIGPAGLKLYQPPRPTSAVSSSQPSAPSTLSTSQSSSQTPQHNISIIDKVVNRAKSQATEARERWDSVWGSTKETKQKEAEVNKIRAEAQRYETRKAREDEWRREEVNRERREKGMREG